MTNIQREEAQKIIDAKGMTGKWVAVDTRSIQIGEDDNGFPIFETIYEEEPKNNKLIRLIPEHKGAILEDLDHEPIG